MTLDDIIRQRGTKITKAAKATTQDLAREGLVMLKRNWQQGKAGDRTMPTLSPAYSRRIGRTRRTLRLTGAFERAWRIKKVGKGHSIVLRSGSHPRTGGGKGGRTLSNRELALVQAKQSGGDIVRLSTADKARLTRIARRKVQVAQGGSIKGMQTIRIRL